MRGRPELAALVVALLAATPGAQSASPPPQSAAGRPGPVEVPYTQFTLPNGLTVILHEDHTIPAVSVNVWYHVGSAYERPGRTGFAHLFEHLMFEGSAHVREGDFDSLIENVGGSNNGSTDTDNTNYFIDVPSNALELALYLESDRMGYLLEAMSPARVDGQRDVVKNERRQSYENRPYGMAEITLGEMLYPENHPYHWPTIGYMDDLSAATYSDVVEFFKRYYAPNNASLVVAGDINPAAARPLVEKWFSEIPRGPFAEPLAPPAAFLSGTKSRTLTDQVRLPRLYLAWLTPRRFEPGDAALDVVASVLSGGKNSRLFRRLMYDEPVAQDVSAFQASSALGSSFLIVATARPGHPVEEIRRIVDEELEKLRQAQPESREVERAINQIEASFYRQMERVGGFGGKAGQLNGYYAATGDPDFFAEDLARYRALSPSDISAAVRRFLPGDRRVELIVAPGDAR
jgi:zinc protease